MFIEPIDAYGKFVTATREFYENMAGMNNIHTEWYLCRNGMGLYLDESMENGRSEHCDTFDNRSLASSDDFVVRILEVIGFA